MSQRPTLITTEVEKCLSKRPGTVEKFKRMSLLLYFLVFLASFLVDVIPFVGPPAWTVMVFFQIRFQLNMWLVLLCGVTGSAIGRYYYSVYVKWLSNRFIKEEKNHDMHFLGSRLSEKGWKVQLFVLAYTLIPVPTTPLFTAAGVAGIKPWNIMPAFFVGKFISDAMMVFTGDYVAENISSMVEGFLSWQTVLGTALGLCVISMFFFIDWQKLLLEKKLKISFHIWK